MFLFIWSIYFQLFRKDEEVKRKLVESYKLMLDFYGIRLVDETTGEVERADNWEERFSNLNRFLLSCFSFLWNFNDVVSILL